MQVVKFINQKNEEVEFSHRSSTLLVQIDGLSGLESTDVSYTGYMQDGEAYQSSRFEKRQIIIKFHVVCESESNLLTVRSKIHRVFNPKLGSGTLVYEYKGVSRKIKCVAKFHVVCESESNLLTVRSKIHRVFNPKLGSGTLVYEYKGVSRKIKCVADGLPTMALKSRITDCEGEVVLLAHDPFLQDVEEKKLEVATWRNALKFPLTITRQGMIFGYKEPSLIANIINEGDIECGLTIEFIAKGTVLNPSLLNINTQEYIKVNRTMTAGEKIIISTGYNNKKIVSELDGITTNIMNYLDLNSTFLQLEVGDNLFRYDADDNLSQLEVKKIVSELDGITTNIMNYLDLNSTFLQLEVGDNLFRYDADDNLSQLEVNIRYTQRYLGI